MIDDPHSILGLAMAERFKEEVSPIVLPVRKNTWRSLKMMGVDLDQGQYVFLDEGTHIWQSFFQHYGWWKTNALGFYPYTDLRDYEAHERQGLGRPWLRLMPQRWQELIFRELILLINGWNHSVSAQYEFQFGPDEELPSWVKRWLSLTNESWRKGAAEFEEELYRSLGGGHESDVSALVQRYQASALTWRPMMPDSVQYHRRYGKRDDFYTFIRSS